MRVASVLASMLASAWIGNAAHATLLDFQLTVQGSAGPLPDVFLGTESDTNLNFSVATPSQTSLNPGDVVEVDLLAPAGLEFLITHPANTTNNTFLFSVGNATAFGSVASVAAQSTSVSGPGESHFEIS